MKIENTLYHNEKSVRIQPTLPAYVVSALKRWGDGNRISKGIVAYELILLESNEYVDSIDRIGGQIENEFRNLFDTVPEDFERKIITGTGIECLFDECEYANPYEQLARTNLHIPQNLRDQMEHTRGIGDLLTDAVEHFAKVPWNSRTERLEILKQLVEYQRDGTEPSHPFVEKIISGESTDLNELLFGDSEKWWLKSDLTIDDINDGQGKEISQKSKDERITALQTALDNLYEEEQENIPPAKVEAIVRDAFGLSKNSQTASEYADEIDYWWFYENPYPNLPWFESRIEEIYKNVLSEQPNGHHRTEKLKKLNPIQASRLNKRGVNNIVLSLYESTDELVNALEVLLEEETWNRVHTNPQQEVNQKVVEYIKQEIKRLKS